MRVVAGRYRGLRLTSPEGLTTRPMTDRVKETLFNILGHKLEQPGSLPPVAALDLFAGSGGMGIEALSRGAESCLFVERDRRSLRILRENIRKLHLSTDSARIATDNAWTMRVPPAPDGAGYGLVFADPPYRDAEDVPRVLSLLERLAPRLSDGGLVTFRHGPGVKFPEDEVGGLLCIDERRFGPMRMLLFQRAVSTERPAAQEREVDFHPVDELADPKRGRPDAG